MTHDHVNRHDTVGIKVRWSMWSGDWCSGEWNWIRPRPGWNFPTFPNLSDGWWFPYGPMISHHERLKHHDFSTMFWICRRWSFTGRNAQEVLLPVDVSWSGKQKAQKALIVLICVSTNFQQEAVKPTTLLCTLYSLYAKDRMPGLWKTGKMPSHKLRKTSRSENPCNHDLHPTHQSSSRMPERQRIAAVVDSFFPISIFSCVYIYIYIFSITIYIYNE